MNRNISVAILLVVIGFTLIGKMEFSLKEKPRLMKTIVEMDKIRDLVLFHKKLCGQYPEKIFSYGLLEEAVGNRKCSISTEFANEEFRDRWGNSYIYIADNTGFRILSLGHEWIETTARSSATIVTKPM
ncbi:hypothetical protein [Bdellovibrio bacteriovorus]|uniref:hypothetical protein n=1 Tax=Bdellovibrio bacteriovorus TaxID=959 RepID=UPI0005A22467|nr:hypothetical protein [Bdellovibrio bacteriovorus]